MPVDHQHLTAHQNKSPIHTNGKKKQRLPAEMFRIIVCFLLLYLFLENGFLWAQTGDSVFVVKIHGMVTDAENKRPVPSVMVVNKRTQQGFFTSGGEFDVKIFTSDTLLIGSTGYKTITLFLPDTLRSDYLSLPLSLEKLSYQAREVEVFGARDLDKIQQDIEKLGYDKKDYILSDIDALNSPITFLYQQFSRKERAKRDLAELKNNDRKRALLKELFSRYAASDIMDLDTQGFDDFIDYLQIGDEFMKNSTQYEFILFIKKKYEIYKMIKSQENRR